jgi:hypothetical protein
MIKVPGTAKEIVEALIVKRDYTIKQIADVLGVTSKTIYRVRKGFCPHPQTHLNLIQLYLTLYQQKYEQKIAEEGFNG